MSTEFRKAFYTRRFHERSEFGVKCFKENVEVRVMAIADGYAMVRGKNEIPFVVDEMELQYHTYKDGINSYYL